MLSSPPVLDFLKKKATYNNGWLFYLIIWINFIETILLAFGINTPKKGESVRFMKEEELLWVATCLDKDMSYFFLKY